MSISVTRIRCRGLTHVTQMRDARGDACVECVRRMRRKREISGQIVTHASFRDAGASYRVSVTHASSFGRLDLIGEALLSTKEVPHSSTGATAGSADVSSERESQDQPAVAGRARARQPSRPDADRTEAPAAQPADGAEGEENEVMSVREISAHEATLKTATVELRTLTVNGKQVTLAVFRQLLEMPLMDDLDEDGHGPVLAGQAWGTVNYHPDKCGDGDRHLHVVWQSGAHLRRSLVAWKLPEWSENWQASIEDQRYLAVLRRIVETGGEGKATAESRYWFDVRSGPMGIRLRDREACENAKKVIDSFRAAPYEGWTYSDTYAGKWYKDPAFLRGEILASAQRMAGSETDGLTADATWALASREWANLAQARARYREMYADLESLDQLFIAV